MIAAGPSQAALQPGTARCWRIEDRRWPDLARARVAGCGRGVTVLRRTLQVLTRSPLSIARQLEVLAGAGLIHTEQF